MSASTTVAVVNTAIVLSIAAITIGGIILTGQFYGLWSMFLMMGFMSVKRDGPTSE